jgi:hypothetical protein
VVDVPASDLGPGPAGQRRKIIGATIGTGDTVVLVVDPIELSLEVTA